ncbi:MAG: tRNA guanosine(34) transglycosylase Tgt [Actinomycetota bacterium]|nr:tRNA guanosine(34) transglycosylase Tgt [Actinomycetota bacterium]
MSAVTWQLSSSDDVARTGVMKTPHGDVETPNFMPVGTRATVKTMDVEDLRSVGAQIVLANTYHLMLRPGEAVVSQLGELHGFMAWDGPILTDSGGYQVLSLNPKINEEGLIFRSTYDGARVELTPERAVAVQEALGSDIAMVLDVPVPLPSPRAAAEEAMQRTHRWAERALAAKERDDRALFGIVQGGAEPDLREQAAKDIAALGFAGFGIGGLAVGETPEERDLALDAAVPHLPPDRVRYVMGLGDTEGMLAAIARGVDLFDCVIPTRLARHGKALTRNGDISIKRAEWVKDETPLDTACSCLTCRRYSRGYLRHLYTTNEPLSDRLLTLHNLTYTFDLLEGARTAIRRGRFSEFRRDAVAARARE